MLPTNVMSFMKKMVGPAAQSDSSGVSSPCNTDVSSSEGTALSKLRQTLSSGLMTAQDRVTKLTPSARQAAAAAAIVAATETAAPQEDPNKTAANNINNNNNTKSTSNDSAAVKPPCRTGACRVCLKSFKPEEFFRLCGECQQRVCEDCASYSKLDENQDQSTWRCSICRRRAQSRAQPVTQQDSTDSLLEVPVLEALQRRHSDVKISGSNAINLNPGHSNTTTSSSGLAPPRTPELRRHSDVSPASLKELEKVAGERREELRWERELEWRQYGKSRSSSPTVERRPLPGEQPHRSLPLKPGMNTTTSAASPTENPEDSEEWRHMRNRNTIRRKSRAVQRQHSYDDEIKNSKGGSGNSAGTTVAPAEPPALGLPAALPRRASAYDVYAPRVDSTGGGIPISGISLDTGEMVSTKRRSSFRVPSDGPNQQEGSTFDQPSSVSVAVVDTSSPPSLSVDEVPRTRRRGSQLPDLAAVRALAAAAASASSSSSIQPQQSSPPATHPPQEAPPPGMRRQTSVQDGEAIKIVIQDVDSDTSFRSRPGAKRRVILRRDPSDKAHRTRGFGMRVVGGKTGTDGRLFAYIVWTVPGGPAEKGGLQQGDKVLEWDGVPLVDRSFEEVCAVMDRTGDVAELLVEHATDLRMCDLLDEAPSQAVSRKNSDVHIQVAEGEMDKTPTSPTRRKLPKTPGQAACKEMSPLVTPTPEVAPANSATTTGNPPPAAPVERGPVTGRVQIQVFYNDDRRELVVSLMAADELACHEDIGFGTLPEAYVKLRLLPSMGDRPSLKSDVAEPTHNPIWNATLTFPNVPGEDLMDKTLEVTLWDYIPERDPIFLGECTIEMKKAILIDHEVWYRLDDPRCLRQGGKSPHASPRGSLATELAQRLLRRQQDWQSQRSWSDDRDSNDGESVGAGSPDASSLLHPDHAWRCDSRRGSSQSEIVDVEPYNLGKDFSRSLPGSRRSSFQLQQQQQQQQQQPEKEQPIPTYHRERRRSSCSHRLRDPEEILRSLKAVKGELGRTLSFVGDKRVQRRHKDGRKNSVMELSLPGGDADEHDEEAWREDEIELGPAQIHPRGYRLAADRHGELRLGLIITKGQLEVDVQEGRSIPCIDKDNPPDTYVKTYLREGERWMQKRKTRVARRAVQPQFRQTLRYQACDVLGRTLLVMLWEKQKRFEHNQGLGGAEIALDKLQLSQQSLGWYPLYPIESLGSDSDSN